MIGWNIFWWFYIFCFSHQKNSTNEHDLVLWLYLHDTTVASPWWPAGLWADSHHFISGRTHQNLLLLMSICYLRKGLFQGWKIGRSWRNILRIGGCSCFFLRLQLPEVSSDCFPSLSFFGLFFISWTSVETRTGNPSWDSEQRTDSLKRFRMTASANLQRQHAANAQRVGK